MATTVSEALQLLISNKTAIKEAIIGKGVEVANTDAFSTYADKITSIPSNEETLKGLIQRDLTAIDIPDGTVTIGESVFFGCTNLTTIVIPDTVTRIQAYAFNSCTNLSSVTFGRGVTTISGNTFAGCSGLKEMIFTGKVPPTLESPNNSLGSTSATFPIYVPDEFIDVYVGKESFANYVNRITPISERND